MRRKFRQIEENGHHWRQLNFLTVQWQTADEFQIVLMIAYNVWLYSMYKYNVLYKSICTFYILYCTEHICTVKYGIISVWRTKKRGIAVHSTRKHFAHYLLSAQYVLN